MTSNAPLPPPGWHPDPTDATLLRFWNGERWTEYTQADPQQPGRPPVPVSRAQPWWQAWWAIIPGLVLCAPVGLIGLWLRAASSRTTKIVVTAGVALLWTLVLALPDSSSEDDDPTAGPSIQSSPTSTPSTPPTSPTPVSDEPATVEVPQVVGLNAQEARAALRSTGFGPVAQTRTPSRKTPGTVLSISPAEGSDAKEMTPVEIEVAAPLPRIPDVSGMSPRLARRDLKHAGFEVKLSTRRTTSGSDNTVLNQSPNAGRSVMPGATVRLVVSDLHEPPPPPSNCTSGYSPCLVPAYDYDCAGGSGDGPAYVSGTVRVTGSDPYDLDYDGDGYGCD